MPHVPGDVFGWDQATCTGDGTILITNLATKTYSGSTCEQAASVVAILSDYFPESVYHCFENVLIITRSNMMCSYSVPVTGLVNDQCIIYINSSVWEEPDPLLAVFHEALHRAHHVLDTASYAARCAMKLLNGQTDAEEVLTISGHALIPSAAVAENLNPQIYNENSLRLRLGKHVRANHDDKDGRLQNPLFGRQLPDNVAGIISSYL